MISEDIEFFNQTLKLSGTLHRPESSVALPAVVVAHPASAGEQRDPFYDHLKRLLPAHGIAVLVFDRRGSGSSGGDFETADFHDLAGDVVAAVAWLQSRPEIDGGRIGLHGTSQGGWIVPLAAARKPDVACIVAVSASGVSPAGQMNYGVAVQLEKEGLPASLIRQAIELRNVVNEYYRGRVTREDAGARLRPFEGEPWYDRAYLPAVQELPADLKSSKWHYEMDYEPLSVWKQLHQPALFLFAAADEWVPVEHSIRTYRQATSHLEEIRIERIPGTDHLMRTETGETSQAYQDILIQWLRSTLRPSDPSPEE